MMPLRIDLQSPSDIPILEEILTEYQDEFGDDFSDIVQGNQLVFGDLIEVVFIDHLFLWGSRYFENHDRETEAKLLLNYADYVKSRATQLVLH